MQSKTSFFNMALFKKNISRTWIAGLLYFVLLLLMLPVFFVINTANINGDDWYTRLGYTMEMRLYEHMSSIPTTFLAIIISIIVTGITFWYLFNRRDNYMMHSFPVSRRSLFFTGILSSLTVSLLPVVLVSVIMTIAAAARGCDGLACIWYWALIVAVSTLLFTAIAIFSLMISGQIITGIIFYFIFNFLYLMMEIAFRLTASILIWGLSEAMNGIQYRIWTPVLYISEKVRVVSEVVTDDNYERVINFQHSFSGSHLLAIYAVAALVITIVSYQLYRFKKLETVLDFIAVPFMKPVFSVGMSFFISMVAGAFISGMVEALTSLSYDMKYGIAIVSALILGVIIYFATQMLIEKTLRVFCAKKAFACAIYSLAALGVLLCMRLDVLGIENRVPALKDIEWAGIENEYAMVFTDEMEIEAFRQMHQNFLTDKKELRNINYNYPDVDGKTFSIRYKLKNGDIIIRSYPVINTEASVVSSEYVAATQPILDFINNPGRIKEHIIGNIWNDCEIKSMEFSTIVDAQENNDYYMEYNEFDELSTSEKKAKYKRVYEAFLKDIEAGKVFQQDFAGYEYRYEENQKEILYNTFDFVIRNPDVDYFSDQETFYDSPNGFYRENLHEQDIYANLTINCTNTLKALKDEGFYNDENELMTNYEFSKKYENYGYDSEAIEPEAIDAERAEYIFEDPDGDLDPLEAVMN
ncbi:MFS transporter [Pseudobutyrivibrio xylanivorans]|uniref:ABC-2 type transport system permease protein n=1 Tax=Pseudobutyrivibrio xylanivorans DSM 14809 TaxID=1123012 RepID=A0A1M6H0E2_PSEXY|nr:hypothetical protein [Pseudobutyrivibrio xylanivorans]SHJ15633.1 ABC-2 type transport system permease protein [Pseudobutyrivibrio xylanivorans DSM 14809]